MLNAVSGSFASYPITAASILPSSSTVRQIGPCRTLMPGPLIPARLISSCVGERPTTLLADEGMRIDVPVSSPIAQVTRFAVTATADPELEPRGVRSVSYALQTVPPNALRELNPPLFAFARMIAPAFLRRETTVES